jgi:hypothetical protein
MSKILEGIFNSKESKLNEDLRKWFKEKWVRFGPDGKIRGACARGDDSEGKPKCLPQAKAHALGKKGRKYAASKKRREDPNPERSGPAKNVATKKKTNEEQLDELKCWPGYTRVKGVPAGAPGSCKKKTDETVHDVLESKNKLFVKKLSSESELKEYAINFSKNLSLDGVPVSSYNRHYTVCSTIFAANKKTITEAAHIKNGKEFVSLLKRLDQFDSLDIKVGNSVAIINAQLQGDSVELWGFTTPKTITKIFKEPSDHSIKQFEFNNNPDDVWPRTENAEYQGHYLMYSAFFGDKKSAEHANIMLNLQAIGDLSIRNHIKEQDVKEEKCPHCAGPMFSEALMMEKKDACYYKVKSRYKVWPSAYASGALVKCRKAGAKNWGTKSESAIMRGIQNEQDVEEATMMTTHNVDATKFVPGAKVSHNLLGVVTVVRIEQGGLVVKDSRGKEYRISLTSAR